MSNCVPCDAAFVLIFFKTMYDKTTIRFDFCDIRITLTSTLIIQDITKTSSNNCFCYIAENVFPTTCGLIGYFDVTWHLTMENLWAGSIAKSMTSERRPPLQRGLVNFQLQNFQLYNKSLLRLVPQETVDFVSVESQHWYSRETKSTVSLAISH